MTKDNHLLGKFDLTAIPPARWCPQRCCRDKLYVPQTSFSVTCLPETLWWDLIDHSPQCVHSVHTTPPCVSTEGHLASYEGVHPTSLTLVLLFGCLSDVSV